MDQCDTNRFSVDKKFLCNHCPRKFYTKTMFEFHFISGHGSLPPDRSEVQIKAEKIIPSKCQMCQGGSSTADGNALTPKCKECTRSLRANENPKKHFSNVDLSNIFSEPSEFVCICFQLVCQCTMIYLYTHA